MGDWTISILHVIDASGANLAGPSAAPGMANLKVQMMAAHRLAKEAKPTVKDSGRGQIPCVLKQHFKSVGAATSYRP